MLYKSMQMHLHVHQTLFLHMFQWGYTFLTKKKMPTLLHYTLMQTMLKAVGKKLSFCISFDNCMVTKQYGLLKRKSKWPDAHFELSFKDNLWNFYLLSLRNIAVLKIYPIRLNRIKPRWLFKWQLSSRICPSCLLPVFSCTWPAPKGSPRES